MRLAVPMRRIRSIIELRALYAVASLDPAVQQQCWRCDKRKYRRLYEIIKGKFRNVLSKVVAEKRRGVRKQHKCSDFNRFEIVETLVHSDANECPGRGHMATRHKYTRVLIDKAFGAGKRELLLRAGSALQLKESVFKELGIPASKQNLFSGSKLLADKEQVDSATVHLKPKWKCE